MFEELTIWCIISAAILAVALVIWLGQRPRVERRQARETFDLN